jgi:hypothetical protein
MQTTCRRCWGDLAAWVVPVVIGTVLTVSAVSAFDSATMFGGGSQAGPDRTRDFESMAYDEASDILYVFSGPCCSGSVLPTAFRLMRGTNGRFQVESFQPLGSGANYTAAGWNRADRKVYVGVARQLRSYHYVTNTAGPTFRVPNLAGITGMYFSSNGADLFVTTNAEKLHRVNWASKRLVAGWTFDLTAFQVRDSRAVELIDDQFYVLDGVDGRPKGDPLRVCRLRLRRAPVSLRSRKR